jgi:hypothetical protein
LAKEAQVPVRLLGPNKAPVGRFEVPMNQIGSMNLIGSFKSFKQSLKIGFESSTVTLTNLTTLGVAVGATVLAVEVKV